MKSSYFSGFGLLSGVVMLAAIQQMGCTPPQAQQNEDTGTVTVAVTMVPADVGCIRLSAVGATRTATADFDVTPGMDAVLSLTGAPIGTVMLFGDAFPGACPPTGAPNWTSDPVTVQVSADQVVDASLVMHRNGRLRVGVDFQDDVIDQKPTCTDGIKNATETDVDCGGGACPGCANGKACQLNRDCASFACSLMVCTTPHSVPTAIALTSSANPSNFGDQVTFTATVTASDGSQVGGSINFFEGTTFLASVGPDAAGSASVDPGLLTVGDHSITADFQGAGALADITSAPLIQTVRPAQPLISIGAAPSFVVDPPSGTNLVGQNRSVTFTAHVTAQNPAIGIPNGGFVIFSDQTGADIATVPLFMGGASFRANFPNTGAADMSARFTGNSIFQNSAFTMPLAFLVVTPSGSPGPGCDPPDGMVAWWTGEALPRGNYGDSVGTNDATPVNGVRLVSGFRNIGFGFDNTQPGPYLEVPDSADLDLTTAITIDAWIRPASPDPGRIVDKIQAFNNNGYLLDVIGGRLRMIVNIVGIVGGDVPLGNFTHVAGVFGDGRIALYVNGQLSAESAVGDLTIPTNDLPLRIAADSSGNNVFQGVIDEPRIFNRALTSEEILGLYQRGTLCP